MRVILARNAFIRRITVGVTSITAAKLSSAAPARSSANPSIVAVGRRYLALHPREADATSLARALERPAPAMGRARDDFARGDVVVVDGWLLARSEARICALAALTAPDAD